MSADDKLNFLMFFVVANYILGYIDTTIVKENIDKILKHLKNKP